MLIVYDINARRCNKVKSFLREYIFWIQNSVFEGEVTEKEYREIIEGLKELTDENEDSVIIFKVRVPEMMEREIIGVEKASINTIL